MNTWENITAWFHEAACELAHEKVKPMVKTGDFSLLESMSAVELMDPKMDQCCAYSSELKNHTWSTIYGIELPRPLNQEDSEVFHHLCLQLQSVFSAQMSVINGASVMESTHNWVILWKSCWDSLDAVTHSDQDATTSFLRNVLVAFGKAVCKVLGLTNNAVLTADIYEDEDFCPNFRQFIFDQDLDVSDISQELQKLASEAPQYFGEYAKQISSLMQLESHLLLLLSAVDNYLNSTVGYCNRIIKARKSATACQEQDGKKLYSKITENLKYYNIKQLAPLTKSIEHFIQLNLDSLVIIDGKEINVADGSISLYRPWLARLHLVGPLRKVETVKFEDSLTSLQQIARDLSVAQSLAVTLPNHLGTIVAAQDIFETGDAHNLSWERIFKQFSDLSKKNLHLLARSLLVASHHIVSLDLSSYLLNAMHQRGIPKSILSISTVMDEWLTGNPCVAAWESMKLTSICRNRMMSRIENILALWGNVATESMYMDDRIRVELALPTDHQHQWLSSWSIIMTTKFMDMYMQLLMDMDVVDQKEYDYFFWYWDYIYSTQVHALDKLRALHYQLEMALYEAKQLEYRAAIEQNNKKSNKKNKQKLSEPIPPTVLPPFAEDFINRGKGHLCRGLFRVDIIMKQLGVLKRHSCDFTTTGMVFDRRFRPFQDVYNPNPLSYREFIQTINKDTVANDESASARGEIFSLGEESEILPIKDWGAILRSAISCFQTARKCFDEAKKLLSLTTGSLLSTDVSTTQLLTNLTKVCVASLLNTTKLLKMVDLQMESICSSIQISFNWSYDSYHPVLEVHDTIV